jgi:hypothetical protein
MSPQIMGQGAAETATARGYDSFFTNPAGFSRSPGSITITSLSGWMYATPRGLLDVSGRILGGGSAADLIASQITSGGFGAGAAMGAGYVGSGIGLGAFLVTDSFLSGATLADAQGEASATAALVLGLSVPLKIMGITVHAGGDVRPMVRIRGLLQGGAGPALVSAIADQQDLLTAIASSQALYGLGVALDLGVIAEMAGLSIGLSVRDVGGTTFNYTQASVGQVRTALETALRFPSGTAPQESYTVPMDVSAGVALHPELGSVSSLIDPVVHVDVQDIVGLAAGRGMPWTHMHAGLQATLVSTFTLRAGLNQGYFTAGVGVHFFFLDLNAAFFTREMGAQQWESPGSGASLEIAARF